MVKGYIHVYTGNGKGKTTAALGLCLRAVCAGKKVFFGQFLKGQHYSELDTVKYLPSFEIEQFGSECFVGKEPSKTDIEEAKKGLDRMREIIISNKYDVVVFDEINIALFYKLLSVDEFFKVLDLKSESLEVICTGRYAPEEIMNRADLVTEMKEIKHYYTKGVTSRVGIEN